MSTIWLVWSGEYEQRNIWAVYSTRDLAEEHVRLGGGEIEEHDLRTERADWRTYYHAMAQVGCGNPALDREPFVEQLPDSDGDPSSGERVSRCPGSRLLGDDPSLGDAIWLSFFHRDREHALDRVRSDYAALRLRRESGPLPSWLDLFREERRAGQR